MSKTYNKYINNEDHTWYDSSNIVYSVCYDKPNATSLKIVFKGGRTYLYRNVDPVDYTLFRDAESNGKVFNERIKKYDTIKLNDTDLTKLDELKQEFINSDNLTEYRVDIEFNNETGAFFVKINDKVVYQGIEGQVSVINLLRSMKIDFSITETDKKLSTIEEFENKNII